MSNGQHDPVVPPNAQLLVQALRATGLLSQLSAALDFFFRHFEGPLKSINLLSRIRGF